LPSDLLDELDRMEFRVPESAPPIKRRIGRSSSSPATASGGFRIRFFAVVFFTASSFQRAAPAASRERMGHLNRGSADQSHAAIEPCARCRMEKKPSTAEFIAWVQFCTSGIDPPHSRN
jgi:hypothetical protein